MQETSQDQRVKLVRLLELMMMTQWAMMKMMRTLICLLPLDLKKRRYKEDHPKIGMHLADQISDLEDLELQMEHLK